VNALCINSAVPSTSVFLDSPSSVTLRSLIVKSGLLSNITARRAKAEHSWMTAGSTTTPCDAFERAVIHALRLESVINCRFSSQGCTYFVTALNCVCVPSRSSKLTSLQNSRYSFMNAWKPGQTSPSSALLSSFSGMSFSICCSRA